MLTPVWSGRFRRDVKQAERRGKDKLKTVLSLLLEERPLAARYNDHPLKGDWQGFRDLHIEPDWLLSIALRAASCSLPAPAPIWS